MTTSRRQLLEIGLAASLLPAAARAAAFERAAPADTVQLYKVVYDTRFPASVAFARRAAALGVAVESTAGDITRFWYADLYHRWRQASVAIAGLTAHGAMFCLERLAWDQRMRIVFRGEHSARSAGRVGHRLEGPAASLPRAAGLVAQSAWADALADIVAACPAARGTPATAAAVTVDAAAPPLSEPLFSWVIAPVARA